MRRLGPRTVVQALSEHGVAGGERGRVRGRGSARGRRAGAGTPHNKRASTGAATTPTGLEVLGAGAFAFGNGALARLAAGALCALLAGAAARAFGAGAGFAGRGAGRFCGCAYGRIVGGRSGRWANSLAATRRCGRDRTSPSAASGSRCAIQRFSMIVLEVGSTVGDLSAFVINVKKSRFLGHASRERQFHTRSPRKGLGNEMHAT